MAKPIKLVNINVQGWAPRQLTERDKRLTVIFAVLFVLAFVLLNVVTTCSTLRANQGRSSNPGISRNQGE